MFKKLQSICDRSKPPKPIIYLLGLDAVGKTTLLYHWCDPQAITVEFVTIGLNVEKVETQHLHVMSFDWIGSRGLRTLVCSMLRGAAGIVLMVDASAPDRITETAAELHFMLQDQTLQEIPLLVLANKQDVPNAQSVEQVAVSLALMMQVNRPWKIQGCSLLNGAQEVDGGMYWLLQCIVNRQALKAV